MTFHFIQLFEPESSTFSYVIVDKRTGQGVLVDPVAEMLERDLELIRLLHIDLKWILETHIHADHITSSGPLRQATNAKIALSAHAGIQEIDRPLKEGDVIELGQTRLDVLETPGHTSTCLSYVMSDRVLTGDALLIRGCGRTDFQQGNAELLYDSVREKLFCLDDDMMIYPAHNYQGIHSSTIGWEKAYNPRLKMAKSKDDFVTTMSNLNLAYPKKIDQALPGNQRLGL